MEDIRKVDFMFENNEGFNEFSMYFDYEHLNEVDENISISTTFLQHLKEKIGTPIDLSNLIVDKDYNIKAIKTYISTIYNDIISDSHNNVNMEDLDGTYLNLIYYFVYEGGTRNYSCLLEFGDSNLDTNYLSYLIEPLIKIFPHVNNSSKEVFYRQLSNIMYDTDKIKKISSVPCPDIYKKKLRKLAYIFIKDSINEKVLYNSEILYGANEKLSNEMMKQLLEIEFKEDNSIMKT